mmetsp:Transcript_12717/g.44541  ORF Transcript_12717/g.44541 Transcript_12717/m.44541 type:complete len:299 (+) Transcript_12717:611-1507(+)
MRLRPLSRVMRSRTCMAKTSPRSLPWPPEPLSVVMRARLANTTARPRSSVLTRSNQPSSMASLLASVRHHSNEWKRCMTVIVVSSMSSLGSMVGDCVLTTTRMPSWRISRRRSTSADARPSPFFDRYLWASSHTTIFPQLRPFRLRNCSSSTWNAPSASRRDIIGSVRSAMTSVPGLTRSDSGRCSSRTAASPLLMADSAMSWSSRSSRISSGPLWPGDEHAASASALNASKAGSRPSRSYRRRMPSMAAMYSCAPSSSTCISFLSCDACRSLQRNSSGRTSNGSSRPGSAPPDVTPL